MKTEVLTAELIAQCRREGEGRSISEILQERTGKSADDILRLLGLSLHYPTLEMNALRQMEPAFGVLGFAESIQRNVVVVQAGETLALVVADPFDEEGMAWLQERIQQPVAWYLAQAGDIQAYLARHEEELQAIDQITGENERTGDAAEQHKGLSLQSIAADTSPIVKLVNSILYDAFRSGASDIHVECQSNGISIKYRIDGVLNLIKAVAGVETAEQVISRIKVLAELDIAEKRVPQDGRFKVMSGGREIDIRVSIMPSILGEDAVLRILDKQTIANKENHLKLDILGFDAKSLSLMRKLSSEPYGMLLVTGPTGSGKTTTLYAAISEINQGQDKIITIEDPVEYQLPGVLQIPVNEKKGLTFAKGLRAVLRHDPDKILVGEIRDEETAQIAVQSALTGHLVFTSVHANNVFDVLGRFLHMGVDTYSFVSALNGIVAQRLLRVVCPECRCEWQPDAQLLSASGIPSSEVPDYRFVIGQGCGACRGTGYRGRRAIAEILSMNDEIREMIVAREPVRRLKEVARRQGTRFLREIALDLVRSGETTLQEINRVTFVE